ncbi:hypothetical protein BV25DRAFT_1828730 [Artomyces pyxidatus]|uniref:Uncharacterized protein n=1 Tax=Artomyces pyxidatus TaxID=48021 RepID=A0ACB8ST06_9AGAM|nr:hypothetical protein BV25DRAFT_1828730 [Artomyces pyxidatus]
MVPQSLSRAEKTFYVHDTSDLFNSYPGGFDPSTQSIHVGVRPAFVCGSDCHLGVVLKRCRLCFWTRDGRWLAWRLHSVHGNAHGFLPHLGALYPRGSTPIRQEQDSVDPIEDEVRKRIFWGVFVWDSQAISRIQVGRSPNN